MDTSQQHKPTLTYDEADQLSYRDGILPYATANKGKFNDGICLYCKEDVKHSDIRYWIQDNSGTTAVCNHCDVDAVVPKYIFNMTDAERATIIDKWHTLGFTPKN